MAEFGTVTVDDVRRAERRERFELAAHLLFWAAFMALIGPGILLGMAFGFSSLDDTAMTWFGLGIPAALFTASGVCWIGYLDQRGRVQFAPPTAAELRQRMDRGR